MPAVPRRTRLPAIAAAGALLASPAQAEEPKLAPPPIAVLAFADSVFPGHRPELTCFANEKVEAGAVAESCHAAEACYALNLYLDEAGRDVIMIELGRPSVPREGCTPEAGEALLRGVAEAFVECETAEGKRAAIERIATVALDVSTPEKEQAVEAEETKSGKDRFLPFAIDALCGATAGSRTILSLAPDDLGDWTTLFRP
ncbi:hypothetical protein [Prosthecomicrobium sp. N25]|uniref:hypothetical protein n=1 Tax=Prosthecomicrobium sp. N25 TaxID=3129254 RepID=UPI003076A240